VTVGFGTTTQSGSLLELKGFDGLRGFGMESLDGASSIDRAARPIYAPPSLLFEKHGKEYSRNGALTII
jgi:hypothetical protein